MGVVMSPVGRQADAHGEKYVMGFVIQQLRLCHAELVSASLMRISDVWIPKQVGDNENSTPVRYLPLNKKEKRI